MRVRLNDLFARHSTLEHYRIRKRILRPTCAVGRNQMSSSRIVRPLSRNGGSARSLTAMLIAKLASLSRWCSTGRCESKTRRDRFTGSLMFR